MASQQVRNILNNQIDSLLVRAEKEIKNQGKKKLESIKDKLMTPDTITKSLLIDVNNNSCSEAGIEKYEKIRTSMIDKLTGFRDTLSNAKIKLDTLDSKIRPIVEGGGPIGRIRDLKDKIFQPIILPILKGLTLTIPVALFAIPTPPPGVPGLGGLIPKLSDKLRLVNSKAKEITALIASLDGIFSFYESYANKIMQPLEKILSKLNFIIDEIDKLLAFIHSLYLNHIGQCDNLENASNESITTETTTGNENNNVLPDPLGPSPLDQYLSLLESQYNDVYQQVLISNNKKYVERVFALKENLEEDYNVKFKIINP